MIFKLKGKVEKGERNDEMTRQSKSKAFLKCDILDDFQTLCSTRIFMAWAWDLRLKNENNCRKVFPSRRPEYSWRTKTLRHFHRRPRRCSSVARCRKSVALLYRVLQFVRGRADLHQPCSHYAWDWIFPRWSFSAFSLEKSHVKIEVPRCISSLIK